MVFKQVFNKIITFSLVLSLSCNANTFYASTKNQNKCLAPISSVAELEALSFVKGKRNLVLTENVDAVDFTLKKYSQHLKKPYLRLSLSDIDELESLFNDVMLEDGTFKIIPGPLKELLLTKEGGILLIDYHNSHPAVVEGLNSLFDRNPKFRDYAISANLKIVGVMSGNNLDNHPVSFSSRFDNFVKSEISFKDPLEYEIRDAKDSDEGYRISLYQTSYFEDELLGKFYLNAKGMPAYQEGDLIKALAQGKPIILDGGDWMDEKFRRFIRNIIADQGIFFNGKFHHAQSGFKFLKGKAEISLG